jgi:hypothetical protein
MSTSKACVPVYSAVTRPSGGLVFGAGQGLLDTVWTRVGQGCQEFKAEGGHGGQPVAAYRRKDLVNLFHFSSAPTKSLHFLSDCFIFHQAPPEGPARPLYQARAVHTPTEP